MLTVESMRNRAVNSTGRESLIAGGIAAILSDPDEPLTIDGVEAWKWLQKRAAEVNAAVQALYDEYRMSETPEEKIDIRNRVLSTGLPGYSTVDTMWIQRDSVR